MLRDKGIAALVVIVLALLALAACGATGTRTAAPTNQPQAADSAADGFQQDFHFADRTFSDTGENSFFILKPGYQTVLASASDTLTITVLSETRMIGEVTTRVVEEREAKDGELYEVSRNFYAIDTATGDVFYFGEEVDFYEQGVVSGHKGAWLAYDGENRPGMIMAASPTLGMRYYQEVAPGVAMDRAEVKNLTTSFETPAGTFADCLVTEETTPLESGREQKTYAPGIGLVQDQNLLLISYGYTTAPQ